MRGKLAIFSRFLSHFCQLYYLDRIAQSILYDFENSSCAGVVTNVNFSRVIFLSVNLSRNQFKISMQSKLKSFKMKIRIAFKLNSFLENHSLFINHNSVEFINISSSCKKSRIHITAENELTMGAFQLQYT